MSFLRLGVSPSKGLAAVALAGVGAAAFPPVDLWPFVFLSITGFLALLKGCGPREALNLGLVYGVFYGLGTMYWLFGIFGAQAFPLIALMGGYFDLLGILIGSTQGVRPLARAALVATFAVGVEWLRGDAWYLRFPWYTAPHALAASPIWIAGARWLGVYGLSFAVWFIAGAGIFIRPYFLLAFLVLPFLSFFLSPIDQPDRRVLLIQGEETSRIEQLIKSLPPQEADLVVMPEYAFTSSVEAALKEKDGPTALIQKIHAPLVFGAVVGGFGEPKYDNVAAVIDSKGQFLGAFAKQHPVPLMHDGRPGRGRPVFRIADGEILGVAICYDLDAPEVAASLIRQGATVLVVPTFDAMSWGKIQHDNHELVLRLRAVENDRWILRSASSGRSEVIDPHGRPS